MTTPDPASQAQAPPKGKGLPKKILGLPTPVALGIAAGGLVLIFLVLRKKSAAAAAAPGAACTDANGNPGTTDSSGNCISTVTSTASSTDSSGQPCQDQNGNPGITDALGNCVTTGGLSQAAGTGASTGGDSGGGTGTVGTTGGTGTTSGGTPPTAPVTPPAGAATVSVPNVRNLQVNAGIAALTAAGLKYHLSSVRNPADTYIINSQTPAPGTKVAKGSNVDLGIAAHTFPKE
jgi:hypothetical protein